MASYVYCVNIVYLIRWRRSAPRVRVIFPSWWKRSRAFYGVTGWLSIYIVSSRLLRLVGRLVFAFRGGVSLVRLVVLLVSFVSS